MELSTNKYCVLIPVYNHSKQLQKLMPKLLDMELEIILIDDGSSRDDAAQLLNIADHDSVHYYRHMTNSGKGAAVKTGIAKAVALGFSHAIQIDADGQHDLTDVDRLKSASFSEPDAMIVAYPEYDESIPRHRLYARYLTHFWVWVNTLSFRIKDSMCGFRVYPLDSVLQLVDSEYTGNRMDFDIEVLVRWAWRDLPFIQMPTKVIYPRDGVSHFQAFNDNVEISKMHTRLFFGMLVRLPKIVARRI